MWQGLTSRSDCCEHLDYVSNQSIAYHSAHRLYLHP
jgi:hypothetical protein